MQSIEQHISQYIESQFPAIFREDGPVLVQFVKAYYEWMESTGQTLWHSRRLPSYRDIDTTLDEFITHFKLKYLPNIQFTTASSKRLFVKNALDFHRSKGSPRSVELFFKLIYGVSANIYYPGDDLFRTSDGEWIVPIYLEISPSPRVKEFIGQTVTGVTSFATGFVESYNRVRVRGKYIDVFYLSDVNGRFQAGELLKSDKVSNDNPRVEGSVSEFDIVAGGAGFDLGERVGTISDNGQFATAIVSGISNIVGAANVILRDGGFGYNSTSEILISDKTLVVRGLSNTGFENLEVIQEYYANGQLASNADVIGMSNDHVVTVSAISGEVTPGQRLIQGDVSGVISKVDRIGGTVLEVSVNDVTGFFKSSVAAVTNTGAVNVTSYSALVGIANVSGPGAYTSGNQVVSVKSGLTGTIFTSAQTSNDLSFSLGANNRFSNRTTANVGLDYMTNMANTRLNAVTYNLPKDPSANGTNVTMANALRFETKMFGTITNSAIISIYSGSGYTQQPFVLIKESIIETRKLTNYDLEIDNQQSSFLNGERVITGTMAANGSFFVSSNPIYGMVVSSVAGSSIKIKRLSVDRRFYEHDSQNFAIIGETSGAAARIRKANTYDAQLNYAGLNADIEVQVFTSGGQVNQLQLETSGYGYVDGEQVAFFSLEDRTKSGLATLRTLTHGVGAGYYGVSGGSLSGIKHLQDNDYYQEYSYEIRTSIQQDTYKQMFDQVLHVAGTKGFSSYLSEKSVEMNVTFTDSQLSTLGPNEDPLGLNWEAGFNFVLNKYRY